MSVSTMERREEGEVLFERRGAVGIATLNRPRALNALTENMIVLLFHQYSQWNADPSVAAIVLRGYDSTRDKTRSNEDSGGAGGGGGSSRKAFFCAGGDVKAAASAVSSGRADVALSFFRSEYRLNFLISRLRKPHVALIDGIVMGGGAGLSVHGRYRVATRETLFAMPECAIGLFPDVGTTFFLPRACCRGGVGGVSGSVSDGLGTARWIALTGARLRGRDTVDAGVATHLVPRERLEGFVDALCASLSASSSSSSSSGREEEEQGGSSSSSSWIPCWTRRILFSPPFTRRRARSKGGCPVAAVLEKFEDKSSPLSSSPSSSSYASFAADVERLFGGKSCSSLAQLREAVSREMTKCSSSPAGIPPPPEWLRSAAAALEAECPQSQALSWALLEAAAAPTSSREPFSLADTLRLEWRILNRVSLASASSDFVEGVAAKLLSKPARPATWRGPSDAAAVAAALAPFAAGECGQELGLEEPELEEPELEEEKTADANARPRL